MRSPETRVSLYVPSRAATLACVFWGISGSVAHSQDSPAPPVPHARPVLPDTHVPPRPVAQEPGVVLHIDAPVSVADRKCSEPDHRFNIKYAVINNTTEPAKGTILAMFNGVSLTPVGSAKLELPPGKKAGGTFVACCPSSGSFAARMDYQRDEASAAQDRSTGHTYYASDSRNISCR
jgi:hypothetical protein